MEIKGMCPKTNKTETVYCDSINCSTFDHPNNYIIGLMYACSVIKSKENLCKDCPIYTLNKDGD